MKRLSAQDDNNTQTTNSVLVTPKIAQINDTNGNIAVQLPAAASAVNYLQLQNSGTAGAVGIEAKGSDTNISVNIVPKGSGRLASQGVFVPTISSTDTLTNKDLSSSTNTFPTGSVVGFASTVDSTYKTGTNPIPLDNTIPQITEGVEYMTCAITPKSTTNKLEIKVMMTCSSTPSAANLIMALFQDSTANALAATTEVMLGDSNSKHMTLLYTMTAGTTSSTTFKVRAGTQGGNTFTMNGRGAAGAIFGGVANSSITITEYKA